MCKRKFRRFRGHLVNTILVIILNWNDSRRTLRLVRQFRELENDSDILVIDNCSTDEERGIIESLSQEHGFFSFYDAYECMKSQQKAGRLLLLEDNLGYAKGNNIGLKIALENNYRYALVSNSDISLGSQTVGTLINCIRSMPNTAAVGPKIVTPSGSLNYPMRIPGYYEYIFRPMLFPLFRFFERMSKAQQKGRLPRKYWISGSFILLDLHKVSEVGFFDERTFLYMEEPILAEKLRRRNLVMRYCDEVTVIHECGSSTKKLGKNEKIQQIRFASEEFYLKEYRNFGKVRMSIAKLSRLLYWHFWSPIIVRIGNSLWNREASL